jgi:hypothetical protein
METAQVVCSIVVILFALALIYEARKTNRETNRLLRDLETMQRGGVPREKPKRSRMTAGEKVEYISKYGAREYESLPK